MCLGRKMHYFVILMLFPISLCEPVLTPVNERRLEEFIAKVMEEHSVPGLSLAIVKKGEKWTRGFGYADVEKGSKVDQNTLFAIGSLTKSFTVALLGILLEHRTGIDWDTPIRDILGRDFVLSDDIRTSQTSLADLLSHRMGYPSYFSPMLLVGFPERTTRKEMVRRLRYMESKYAQPFRTAFTYSNYMYNLAGYVAERLAGGTDTWETLTRDRILKPLVMDDSLFSDIEELPENMAMPHVSIDKQIKRITTRTLRLTAPFGPAGSMASSAEDMAKWMSLHMRNDSLLSSRVLSDIFQPRMAAPFGMKDRTLPYAAVEDVSVSYNLGWMTSVYRGYKKVWHSGGISSYASHLWLFPEMDIGIYACTNGPSSHQADQLLAIMYYTTDLVLGLKPWLEADDVLTKLNQGFPTRRKIAKPGLPFWNFTRGVDDYTGIFRHLAFGNITVYSKDQELHMKMGLLGHAKLVREGGENEFLVKWIDELEYLSTADDSLGDMPLKFIDNLETIKFSEDLQFVRNLQDTTPATPGGQSVCYYTSVAVTTRFSFVSISLVLLILIFR